ncbi:MAG: winged helix-turn-helix transcriptional regulator [Phycisphaerae bacterium]
MNNASIENLITLFHRRWAVPVLAELARRDGAKFVTLTHTLQASPAAVRQTLDSLIDLGWVMRNPGHGHPLRPEYILTPGGAAMGERCVRIDGRLRRLQIEAIALKKWSMPVLYVVSTGARRFTDIAAALGSATDRAVALSLKDLSSSDLVSRRVTPEFPPATAYLPTPRGGRLAELLMP